MKKIKASLRKENGFTLLEMLVVILIISILLILVVTNLDGVNDTVTATRKDGIIQTVESHMLIYEMQEGVKPSANDLFKKKIITEKQKEAYLTATKNSSK